MMVKMVIKKVRKMQMAVIMAIKARIMMVTMRMQQMEKTKRMQAAATRNKLKTKMATLKKLLMKSKAKRARITVKRIRVLVKAMSPNSAKVLELLQPMELRTKVVLAHPPFKEYCLLSIKWFQL
jgi:hypothetical protein